MSFKGTVTTLLMLVGGLCLGILIASYVIFFQKRLLGRFMRALIAAKAEDEASAKSLADLGFEKSGLIKNELSRASVSRKLVSVVDAEGNVTSYEDELRYAFPEFAQKEEEEKPLPDGELIPDADREDGDAGAKPSFGEKTKKFFSVKKFKLRPIDFATARFFIPDAHKYRAEFRFRDKGGSPLFLVLATLLVIVFFFLALRFIPAFVNMLDVSISNIKGY